MSKELIGYYKAGEDDNELLAQITAGLIRKGVWSSASGLDPEVVKRVDQILAEDEMAKSMRLTTGDYSPDQPRDENGQWTSAGGSSAPDEDEIKNSSGASEEATGFIKEAKAQIKRFGSAEVDLSKSTANSELGQQVSLQNTKLLEKELKQLAEENGLLINFRTLSKTRTNAQKKLAYGYSHGTTTTKRRVMYAYPGRSE